MKMTNIIQKLMMILRYSYIHLWVILCLISIYDIWKNNDFICIKLWLYILWRKWKNNKPNIMFIEINDNKWNPKSGKTNRCRSFCNNITLHLEVIPLSKFAIYATWNQIRNVSYVLHIKIFCTSHMDWRP